MSQSIPVDRIDPAEALRRIRGRLVATKARAGKGPNRIVYQHAIDIIDTEWPNGAEP
jgi:hypothetical protein